MAEDRTALLVADSFRVRANPVTGEAEVRGLGHHIARFSRAAWEASGRTLEGTGNFLDEARARIAEYGEGWPRLELRQHADTGDLAHELRLRPLPRLGESVELRSAARVEFEHPTRKGPNIARYAELNRELGAEALLLDAQGNVVEGTTTALVWWRDDSLCTVQSGNRVPSVTEALMVEAARLQGAVVRAETATARDLLDCEVWAVNALHGIRRVTGIDGAPILATQQHAQRLQSFREALDQSWQTVVPVR